MDVKTLAKELPPYGQQAVGSALTALSVAGHLRRVISSVGEGDQVRWAFRTYWSRTARDNEWWAHFLTTAARPVREAPPEAYAEHPTAVPTSPVAAEPPATRPAISRL